MKEQKRYVDINPAIEFLKGYDNSWRQELADGVYFALRYIEKLPTADVQEVKHGKPIVYEAHGLCKVGATVKEYTEKREKCPFCGTTLYGEWAYYCDKCGAKMDRKEE